MSSLTPYFFLLLLCLPLFAKAETDSNAPAKFYDSILLEKKLSESSKQPASSEKKSTPRKNKTSDINNKRLDINNLNELDRELMGLTPRKRPEQKFLAAEPAPETNRHLTVPTLTFEGSSDADSQTHLDNNSDANADEKIQTYVVEKSDTLYSIATRFNVTPAQLAAWNNLSSVDFLQAGQKLIILNKNQIDRLLYSSKIPKKNSEKLGDISQKTSIISNDNKSMLKFFHHLPTKGKIIKTFSQTGGRGIEISGRIGQAIKAVADGRVVAVSPGIYGHGSIIVIQHGNQLLSSYTNNRHSLVGNGQRVSQGQVIAEMGRVGQESPSLEFEIRKNGRPIDPMVFMQKKDMSD